MMSSCQTSTKFETRPLRRDGVACRSFDDEAVLYDVAHHSLHYLNTTARFIWDRCDGRRGVDTIGRELADAFETETVSRDAVVEDVRQAMAGLVESGLVEFQSREDAS